MVGFLAESYVHQSKSVGKFEVSVTEDSVAALRMKASHICVDLNFVHDVHMCLSCQSAAGHLIKREVFVLALVLVVLRDRPVKPAELQELTQLSVVHSDRVVPVLLVKLELCLHHDVVCDAHQGSLDLHHGLHLLHRLVRYVVNIRNALRRHRHLVHRKTEEVADTRTDAAVEDEHILGCLQLFWHLSLDDLLELLFAQEERLIVLEPHHSLESLTRDLAERRLEDLVGVLELVEERPQALHLMNDRVVGYTLCRKPLSAILLI